MATEAQATYVDGLCFEMEQDGHRFLLDGTEEFGGRDLGPRPKNLLLSSLLGCTGMDVVSVLGKMKVRDYTLRLKAEAQSSDEHPVYFTRIRITYLFSGKDLPDAKIRKAVELSQERYCGVTYMLSKAAEIDYEIVYADGPAR
jgi:putative redox protein